MDYTDLLGKPFQSGGRGPHSYDCLGLLIELYKRRGIEIEDFGLTMEDGLKSSNKLKEVANSSLWVKIPSPELYCVIIIKQHPVFINHLGIYLGCGKFIHVSGQGVSIDRVFDYHYSTRIIGFYRYEQSN